MVVRFVCVVTVCLCASACSVCGKKTPGGAGTLTGHADAQRHTDRTDEPHNHRRPPTTHNQHVSATTEAAADSRAAGPESTAPRGRLVPVKRHHRGEPGHTRDCTCHSFWYRVFMLIHTTRTKREENTRPSIKGHVALCKFV